jgi:hypothetical protein
MRAPRDIRSPGKDDGRRARRAVGGIPLNKTPLVILAALLALPLVHADVPRTDVIRYTGGTSVQLCTLDPQDFNGVGGACAFTEGIETSVTMTLRDDLGLPVTGQLGFVSGGVRTMTVNDCSGTITTPVPEGTDSIIVYLFEPGFGLLDCGFASAASTGTITLAWS